MNSSDPKERLERLKQVLADSHPPRSEDREPLPESIRAALRGENFQTPRVEDAKAPLMERLLSLFRGPQLVAIGATAIVVLIAVIVLNPPGTTTGPNTTGTGGGTTMRSTGKGAGLPAVIVLSGLDDARATELKDSGYFREDQLLRIDESGDLTAFLESHRRPSLVLVDGTKGALSTPFAEDADSSAASFGPDDDLASLIIDILAELPGPEVNPKSE